MLFPEQDAPFLKDWLVKRLGQTSDADADVLADYVLALLRHDGDVETVRSLCMAEIPDFLKEDSATFIRDVFDAINYKSYLPGTVPPPPRSSAPFAPPTGPSSMPNYGLPGPGAPPFGGSRKRTYNDRGDGDAQDRGGVTPMGDANGRMYKQPRRGGMGGRGGHDNFGHGRGGGGYIPSFPPPNQGPPPQLPPLDPNDPMAFMMAMQSMGIPIPPPTGPPIPNAQPRRGRCRDYDQKGFCARGNTCMFEHGENSIFLPPGNKPDEYDPADASIMTGVESNGEPAARGGFGGNFNNGMRGGNDRGRGRGAFRGGQSHGNANRRNGRSEFSSDRPNHDRTKTTIVVENIPEDKFSEEAVKEFFSQFGNIVDISMRPYKRLSIVKYEDWNGAQAAYGSPKVIFDNRFVKVYWFTSQENLPQPPQATSANGNPVKNGNFTASQPSAPAPARESDEPPIDPEEFARKQEEAQKMHEEKAKKKLEMEAARKELEKRSEELAKSRAEEKKKLMEKLAAKTAKSGSESGIPAPTTETKSVSQTDALKAQLAALEAEAHSLGIDTSLTDDTSSSYGYRGRGRGRGSYRGGRPYNPRGGFVRGGYRGRGGAPFAGGSAYKLDNRPKKIALTGVDFSASDKEESLRQYLLGIGEYASLDITPSSTSITFKERFVGEKFMYGLTDGEIPGAGKVEMTWVQTPLPPINLPPGGLKREDEEEGGDAMALDDSPVRMKTEREPVGGDNLDYDVADDGDYAL